MKEKIDFHYSISGDDWLKQKRPCVYVWLRPPFCLYVGKSDDGVQRLFSTHHHVINKLDTVRSTDIFKLLWVPIEHLFDIEAKLIRLLEPEFNLTHVSNDTRRSWLRDQGKIEGALEQTLSDLTDKVFGGKADDLSKLTEAELDQLIQNGRKMNMVINKLKG